MMDHIFYSSLAYAAMQHSIQRTQDGQQEQMKAAARQQAAFEENKRRAWGHDAIDVEAREIFDVPLIEGPKP